MDRLPGRDGDRNRLECRRGAERARGGQALHGARDCRRRGRQVVRGLRAGGAGIREGGQIGPRVARRLLQPGKRAGENGRHRLRRQELRALPGARTPGTGHREGPPGDVQARIPAGPAESGRGARRLVEGLHRADVQARAGRLAPAADAGRSAGRRRHHDFGAGQLAHGRNDGCPSAGFSRHPDRREDHGGVCPAGRQELEAL